MNTSPFRKVETLRTILLALALAALSPLPEANAGEKNSLAETPPPHSFLDPIKDFARDSILHPKTPFEMVPGKDPNSWGFSIEPYLWLMGINGTSAIGTLPAVDISANSQKVLQQLEWGVMSMAELRKGRWGILADGYYAALSGEGDLGGYFYQSGNLEMQQALASLSLAYRIVDDRRGFLDFYAGARYNYLGIQMTFRQDRDGINFVGEQISDNVASKISAQVESMVASFKTQDEGTFTAAVENELSAALLSPRSQSKASPENLVLLDRLVKPSSRRDRGIGRNRDSSAARDLARNEKIRSSLDQNRLRDVLASARGDIRKYIHAEAAAKLAASNGTLTSEIQSRADAAKKKLAQSISSALADSLPLSESVTQWWIDPIVGLRGQINLTRWLFLAAQGDVGGFGVGSQITWNTQATVGVNFTRNVFAELGYRYMYVDYNKNDFLYQMNSFGLFSSIGVKF